MFMDISKIYVVGNLLVDEDSMPLKVKSLLDKRFSGIVFDEFDPTENLPDNKDLLIMIDTVKGLKKARIFDDIENFITETSYSLHDFDLGWQLKLYKKLGMIDSVLIIGVPEKGDLKKIAEDVGKIISSLS